jgi:RND family efflux transporter MFP subunit
MKLTNAVLISSIALSSIAVVSCSKEKVKEKELIRPVRFQEVVMSGGDMNRTFSGVSKAGVEVNMSFKVAGTIRSINVKVGEKIKKGKLIASLDKTDYQLMYEQAKVALNNAKVQMNSAKSAFERTSALYENNNASLQDYEGARTAYESAKAMVSSNQRGLQLARSQLSYTNLVAPMEGVVAKVNAEKNENVMPGKVIIEVNSGNDLEVTIGMPETYISRVKEGETVDVKFSSITDKVFEGTISEVSYAISSESSTYPISIILTNPSQEIRPGMAADVTFNFKSDGKKACIVVPTNTIAEDQNGRYVFTVIKTEKDLGIVKKKKVKIGELTMDGIEILEGLEDNELIITAGISKLFDGMTVKLVK